MRLLLLEKINWKMVWFGFDEKWMLFQRKRGWTLMGTDGADLAVIHQFDHHFSLLIVL